MKVLTVVANTPALDAHTLTQAVGEYLAIDDIRLRDTDAAQVFDITCADDSALTPALRQCLYHLRGDFALQAVARPRKKLFISDMDATMVVGETIDEMAETLGIGEAVSAITARAMRGEYDFAQALVERLALMKGIPKATILAMAARVPLSAGAKTLLDAVHQRGMDSCLVSGGFSEFTQQVSLQLGFKHQCANQLSYDSDDCLDGKWLGELVDADKKLATLKRLASDNGLTLAETIAIGDGANDGKMVSSAGLGIAYYGKPALRQLANAEIHSGTLANGVYFL